MNSNNNFKKHFSSLKYLLAIIGLMGVFLSCSDDISPAPGTEKNLAGIIAMRKVPNGFNGYDELSRTIFSNYTSGATVTALYVRPNGAGNQDGTSWTNATSDLQGVIYSVSDATDSKIYVVLVASGIYKPSGHYSMV